MCCYLINKWHPHLDLSKCLAKVDLHKSLESTFKKHLQLLQMMIFLQILLGFFKQTACLLVLLELFS